MINKTIADLKIGERLVFGKYGVDNNAPHPIVWLKATRNNDFITEFVLDYLQFDSGELRSDINANRYNGNPEYELSNIISFLNSEEETWYRQTHEVDEPPATNSNFARHFGFLYWFEDYELESLVNVSYITNGKEISSRLRLPSRDDIFHDGRFSLFKRKGTRTRGTPDMVWRNRGRFDANSYVDYWLRDMNMGYRGGIITVDRGDGGMVDKMPNHLSGLRPVCTLRSDLAVVNPEDGDFQVIPFESTQIQVCTDKELFALFGLEL